MSFNSWQLLSDYFRLALRLNRPFFIRRSHPPFGTDAPLIFSLQALEYSCLAVNLPVYRCCLWYLWMQVCVFVFETDRLVLIWIEFKYSVLLLFWNIWIIKPRVRLYLLGTYFVLLSRTLAFINLVWILIRTEFQNHLTLLKVFRIYLSEWSTIKSN